MKYVVCCMPKTAELFLKLEFGTAKNLPKLRKVGQFGMVSLTDVRKFFNFADDYHKTMNAKEAMKYSDYVQSKLNEYCEKKKLSFMEVFVKGVA